ncbi:MAG: hypothetical protein Q4C01_06140 [Clostridia bacterium]|nr:hypothetical protein [Clostridia bacterium]
MKKKHIWAIVLGAVALSVIIAAVVWFSLPCYEFNDGIITIDGNDYAFTSGYSEVALDKCIGRTADGDRIFALENDDGKFLAIKAPWWELPYNLLCNTAVTPPQITKEETGRLEINGEAMDAAVADALIEMYNTQGDSARVYTGDMGVLTHIASVDVYFKDYPQVYSTMTIYECSTGMFVSTKNGDYVLIDDSLVLNALGDI